MPFVFVGIAVLMGVAFWIVGKARSDEPFIAHVLHPARRAGSAGSAEDDGTRWRWPDR